MITYHRNHYTYAYMIVFKERSPLSGTANEDEFLCKIGVSFDPPYRISFLGMDAEKFKLIRGYQVGFRRGGDAAMFERELLDIWADHRANPRWMSQYVANGSTEFLVLNSEQIRKISLSMYCKREEISTFETRQSDEFYPRGLR